MLWILKGCIFEFKHVTIFARDRERDGAEELDTQMSQQVLVWGMHLRSKFVRLLWQIAL